jgi:SAM-dependent methyltransferase
MLPFDLPPLEGSFHKPIWMGNHFRIGSLKLNVLEYSENFDGWSDDLTLMHENTVGDSHPIDICSRLNAISEIKSFNKNDNKVILEIGCSSGFLIKELIYLFPNSTIVGADVVREPLHKLAKKMPEVPLLRFDILKCPLPEKSIDILIMLNVLEHIDNDNLALSKSFNLLKSGGKLIIEVPAGKYLFDNYDKELNHYRRYNMKDIEIKLKNIGFIIEKKSHIGFILFPIFILIKFYNKIFFNSKNIVTKNIKNTKNSLIFKKIMNFESKYFASKYLPFGIRVVISAIKP